MQLPDFMSYRDRFSNNGFIEKISRIAKRAGIKLVYVAVLLYVLHKIWGEVSDDVKEKAKSKLSIWFDEDELKETSNIFDEDPTSGPI